MSLAKTGSTPCSDESGDEESSSLADCWRLCASGALLSINSERRASIDLSWLQRVVVSSSTLVEVVESG